MGEEIEFENGPKCRISDFHGILTLTLTLDPGMVITFFISHRVLPVYFIEIEETFCGRTDTRGVARIFGLGADGTMSGGA